MKCACMIEEYTQDPQQGRCEYQRLRIPCIPNHKLFDPNNENQKKDYYYSLLSLFVLVKDENDLLKPNETAEQSFIRNYADGSCLHKHQQNLHQMLQAENKVKEINEARQSNANHSMQTEHVDR